MIWTLVVLLLASPAVAVECPSGCESYQGVCACEIKAEQAPSVKPSDEAPPRSGMPAWQAEGVKAALPNSLAADDAKQDQEKVAADAAGKLAAGIK